MPEQNGRETALQHLWHLINANPRCRANVPAEYDGKKKQLEALLALWKSNCENPTAECPKVLAYVVQHLIHRADIMLVWFETIGIEITISW